jgi:hypothetical protein
VVGWRHFLILFVGFVPLCGASAGVCDRELSKLESSVTSQKSLMLQISNTPVTAAATIESFHEALRIKVDAGIPIRSQTLAPLLASAKSFNEASESQKSLIEKASLIQQRLVSDLKHCLDKSR